MPDPTGQPIVARPARRQVTGRRGREVGKKKKKKNIRCKSTYYNNEIANINTYKY